jgi:hypothetical protein
MTISMKARLAMLQQVSRAWLDLTRTLGRFSDAQLLRPNSIGIWSGKDLIAHIANWEQIAAEVIEEAEAGNPYAWPDDAYHSVVDEKNAAMLEPWCNRPLVDVRQYLDDAHFTLMNLAESSAHVRPDLVIYLTETHYAEHADDFRVLANLPR